jgi:hypothetical protein
MRSDDIQFKTFSKFQVSSNPNLFSKDYFFESFDTRHQQENIFTWKNPEALSSKTVFYDKKGRHLPSESMAKAKELGENMTPRTHQELESGSQNYKKLR